MNFFSFQELSIESQEAISAIVAHKKLFLKTAFGHAFAIPFGLAFATLPVVNEPKAVARNAVALLSLYAVCVGQNLGLHEKKFSKEYIRAYRALRKEAKLNPKLGEFFGKNALIKFDKHGNIFSAPHKPFLDFMMRSTMPSPGQAAKKTWWKRGVRRTMVRIRTHNKIRH